MHLTPVIIISLRSDGSTMNKLCKHGFDRYCLMHQTIKQLATRIGGPTVEPKRKFIKVVIKMGRLHTTLASTQQPTPEQCNNTVDLGQQVFADVSLVTYYFMCISDFGQSYIHGYYICRRYWSQVHMPIKQLLD